MEIDCECHGKGIAALVCCHLLGRSDSPLGFVENSSDPSDLQAWCFACEQMYQKEQDLTDNMKAFVSAKMVCSICYENIKQRHGIST